MIAESSELPGNAAASLLAELPSRLSTPSPAPPELTKASDAALRKRLLKEQRQQEQATKKEQRKKEAAQKAKGPAATPPTPLRFTPREWADAPGLGEMDADVVGKRVSILTWNVRPASASLVHSCASSPRGGGKEESEPFRDAKEEQGPASRSLYSLSIPRDLAPSPPAARQRAYRFTMSSSLPAAPLAGEAEANAQLPSKMLAQALVRTSASLRPLSPVVS